MWFCLLGGATRTSRKQETSVTCYILVVECVLLSHKPYSSHLTAQKQQQHNSSEANFSVKVVKPVCSVKAVMPVFAVIAVKLVFSVKK